MIWTLPSIDFLFILFAFFDLIGFASIWVFSPRYSLRVSIGSNCIALTFLFIRDPIAFPLLFPLFLIQMLALSQLYHALQAQIAVPTQAMNDSDGDHDVDNLNAAARRSPRAAKAE